jgi:hypothetical protein
VQESAAAQVGSSPGEARGRQGEAACGLGQAGEPSKEPHVIGRVLVKEVTAHRRLKVSKTESPSRYDTIGTNRVGFGEP